MALPRHIASQRDQHAGAEAELLGPEKRRDHDVPPATQATVGAQADAFAQAVGDEHLLRFGEAELPR